MSAANTRRLWAVLLAGCLWLTGCRGHGGLLVPLGSHEQQDAALLAALAEDYPLITFTCEGRPGDTQHQVAASDGTHFLARTDYKAKGEYQVTDYYFEAWLADSGFFLQMEEALEARGLAWENAGEDLLPLFGELAQEGAVDNAAAFLSQTKTAFDALAASFAERTGCPQTPSFNMFAEFTVEGVSHSEYFYISRPPKENRIWRYDYAYDDYARYFDYYLYGTPRHVVEKNGLYHALARRYGDAFDEEAFDEGFHWVCDAAENVVGEDITDMDWEVVRTDGETVVVACGGRYLLCVEPDGANGYFFRRYISDMEGNMLRSWDD